VNCDKDTKRMDVITKQGTISGKKRARESTKTKGTTKKSRPSALTVQSIRTGGWANPTRSGELKFVDVSYGTDVTVGTAAWAAGQLLNGMANGSDASTRIGRKITMKSLLIRWYVNYAATTAGGGAIRYLVVYDKQANAQAPAITDILIADEFSAYNNLSNRDRFVTLVDHVIPALSDTGDKSQAGVIFKRINLETIFNAGSAGTIGDISSGSVYIFVCQTGGIITLAPNCVARCRIRYTDV